MGQGEVIGIIGLGRMGSAIAQKLAHKNPVQGWNRTARPAPDGVRLADNLGALVQNCTILVTSLFDDPAFDEVSEQLARFDLTGRLVVETSTIAAATLQAAAARLGAAGAALIDAPIAGGPPMVLEARAGMLMGGDAHHVARWQPFAEQLAGRVLHMGPLGAGAAAKTVNNMMLVGYWQVLKEALLTGRQAGLALEEMLHMLAGGPAASGAFRARLPVITGEDSTVGFSVDGVAKDARLFVETAQGYGVDVPALRAALASFEAASAAGIGGDDLARMLAHAYAQI
ncbi:NAD(P)-dependent oxidoreductase [Abyssibius alkaniclasticus]|uniref:NAD(P)-dependent oxidoreductase n=1 Tax=Abyssibius alkaniclasticus TaxID=2881234 RepID=UPI00405A1590|tara:strand:+ start:1524 stop:2378 length:855 start_codon:yes stop_codon:yes gene_type:complete